MTGILVAVLMLAGCCLLHRSPQLQSPRHRLVQEDRSGIRREGLEDPALMMDLMAAMLAAGLSVDRSLDVLARSCSPPGSVALIAVKTALDLGASWEAAWATAPDRRSENAVSELGNALRFAGTTGAPSAAVVTAHAAQFRRRKNREAEQRAAALGVRLVVPLGLCSLPAFVCLGIIPILVGLFPSFT